MVLLLHYTISSWWLGQITPLRLVLHGSASSPKAAHSSTRMWSCLLPSPSSRRVRSPIAAELQNSECRSPGDRDRFSRLISPRIRISKTRSHPSISVDSLPSFIWLTPRLVYWRDRSFLISFGSISTITLTAKLQNSEDGSPSWSRSQLTLSNSSARVATTWSLGALALIS
jgi:hypothetical protein